MANGAPSLPGGSPTPRQKFCRLSSSGSGLCSRSVMRDKGTAVCSCGSAASVRGMQNRPQASAARCAEWGGGLSKGTWVGWTPPREDPRSHGHTAVQDELPRPPGDPEGCRRCWGLC